MVKPDLTLTWNFGFGFMFLGPFLDTLAMYVIVYRCPLLATAAQLSWGRYVIPFETLSYS